MVKNTYTYVYVHACRVFSVMRLMIGTEMREEVVCGFRNNLRHTVSHCAYALLGFERRSCLKHIMSTTISLSIVFKRFGANLTIHNVG